MMFKVNKLIHRWEYKKSNRIGVDERKGADWALLDHNAVDAVPLKGVVI